MASLSSRGRALALLLVAFVAGGVAGVVADRTYSIGYATREREPRRPERRGQLDVDQIPIPLEQLDLTPAERDSLHAIARRWRPKAGEALNDMRARVSDLENNMFAEMLCALSPDKRDRYLASLQSKKFDPQIIEKRFALVRANRCGQTSPPPR